MIFFACTCNVHTYYFFYCWYLFSYPKLNTQSCSKTLIHSVLKNLLRLEGAKSTSLKIAAWVSMYRVQRENSSLHNSSQSKAKKSPTQHWAWRRLNGFSESQRIPVPDVFLGKDKFGFKGGWESTVSKTGRTNGVVESIFRLSSVWRLVGCVQGALPYFSYSSSLRSYRTPFGHTTRQTLRWISFQWRLFCSASAPFA